MYAIKLRTESTSHKDVYKKMALLVFQRYDEYQFAVKAIDLYSRRLRRKIVYYSNDLTELIPNSGSTWFLYIEYKHAETGEDWDKELMGMFKEVTDGNS